MKKRYVIYFSGIFHHGFVKLTFWKRSEIVIFNDYEEYASFGTTFRFKWMADMYCKMLNFNSEHNFDFITFKVQERHVN